MSKRILLIQGHPDASRAHLCGALALSYQEGALAAGHDVRCIDVASLDFPLLQSQEQWEQGPLPDSLRSSQQDIWWAQHVVFFFPLWLGDMPALLKGFLEQVARPGFAFGAAGPGKMGSARLKGRSARIVITMGMPALVYRWYFGAHSLKSMRRNILGFVGFDPVRASLVGAVATMSVSQVQTWCDRMRALGRSCK